MLVVDFTPTLSSAGVYIHGSHGTYVTLRFHVDDILDPGRCEVVQQLSKVLKDRFA